MTKQILLCESEPMIHDLIAEYLSPLGFKITTAKNEAQSLDLIDSKLPDIILLDTHLPPTGVASTMKKIRDSGIRIPVLLMGANYGITSEHDSYELGANGFVEKPFKLKRFLEQLLQVLPN